MSLIIETPTCNDKVITMHPLLGKPHEVKFITKGNFHCLQLIPTTFLSTDYTKNEDVTKYSELYDPFSQNLHDFLFSTCNFTFHSANGDTYIDFKQKEALPGAESLISYKLNTKNLSCNINEERINYSIENTACLFIRSVKDEQQDEIHKLLANISSLDKEIEENPNSPNLYLNKGNIYDELKDYSQALNCYIKAIKLYEMKFRSFLDDAKFSNQNLDYVKETENLEKAGMINHNYKIACKSKGNCLLNLGRQEASKEAFEEVFSFDNDLSNYSLRKALYLDNLKIYDEALDFYCEAIEIHPANFVSLLHKGNCLYKLDKFQEAAECYSSAITINPKLIKDSAKITIDKIKDHKLRYLSLKNEVYWNYAVSTKTLQGHSGVITSLANFDNDLIATGSFDETIKLWDYSTGDINKTISKHSGSISCIIQLKNGLIASASYDKTIKIIDFYGEVVRVFNDNVIPKSLALLDKEFFASGGVNGVIKVMNYSTGEAKKIINAHSASVNCMLLLEKEILASGSSDKTIKIWNYTNGKEKRSLTGHSGIVNALCYLDKKHFASCSDDKTIKIWNFSNGDLKKTIYAHSDAVTCMISIDNGCIASGSDDKSIKIWDYLTGENKGVFPEQKVEVKALLLIKGIIISVNSDKTMKVWL